MKECNNYIQDICDYIDGVANESLCRELEKHLEGCENCRIMVDTLRQTVVLCRDGKRETLPMELQSKLNLNLKKKWEEKFRKNR